jgi:hypothetical protein
VLSKTVMTGGAAIHLQNAGRVTLKNIVADGQNGNHHLWNGLWFDQTDMITVDGFEAQAQNDGLRVSALGVASSTPQYDLFVTNGKITGSGVGLHVGGGFDNAHFDDMELTNNGQNVVIDNGITAFKNQEVVFGRNFVTDQATTGDDFYINDILANRTNYCNIAISGVVTHSNNANGIHVKNWPNCFLTVDSPYIIANAQAGVQIDDASTIVSISPHTLVTGNGGWGVFASLPSDNIVSAGNAFDNTAGEYNLVSGAASEAAQVAPRGNLRIWKPYSDGFANLSGSAFAQTTGQNVLMVMELDDDADAFRFSFGGLSSAWTIQQVVASTSASCGTGISQCAQPVDSAGTYLNTMLPVSFNSGGLAVPPWPGTTANYGGANAQGSQVLALALNQAAASGATTLSFATTSSNLVTGQASPGVGMYVQDGTGAIPATTQVTAVSATTITLSAGVGTAGLAAGQQVFFSWRPLTLSMTVPAAVNGNTPNVVRSDWLPMSTQPRTDGGEVAGMAVSGPCIATGTTITSVTPTQVNLSTPTTNASCNWNTMVAFSTSTNVTSWNPGSNLITLGSTFGVRVGESVSGANIPSGAQVLELTGSEVRLNATPTGTPGPLTFSINAAPAAYPVAAGSSYLPFVSTSGRPLLFIRLAAKSTGSTAGYSIGPNAMLADQALGFPLVKAYTGGVGNGNHDGINNVAATNNACCAVAIDDAVLVYSIEYLGRHRGVTIAGTGDSHYSGSQSASQEASFMRLAGLAATTPTIPVSVANLAQGGQNPNTYFPTFMDTVLNDHPEVVIMQGWSHNGGDFPQSYMSKLASVCNVVGGYGGRCIVSTELPRQSRLAGAVYTLGNTSNSSTLALRSTLHMGASGSGFAVSGNGIPPGTTATLTDGLTQLALSAPASVSDMTLVNFGTLTTASAVSGTAVTFSTPVPFLSGGYVAYAACLPAAGAPITLTAGSTSATFASTVSCGAGVPVQIGTSDCCAGTAQWALSLNREVYGSSATLFDADAIVENPDDQTYFLPGYSTDGVHLNDYGQAMVAAGLTKLLSQTIIGQ